MEVCEFSSFAHGFQMKSVKSFALGCNTIYKKEMRAITQLQADIHVMCTCGANRCFLNVHGTLNLIILFSEIQFYLSFNTDTDKEKSACCSIFITPDIMSRE